MEILDSRFIRYGVIVFGADNGYVFMHVYISVKHQLLGRKYRWKF